MKTTCEEVITMPTMQEIDHADKRAQEYSSALYVLLEPIFEAARRGVEADKRESENAIIMSLSANQTEAMYRRAETAEADAQACREQIDDMLKEIMATRAALAEAVRREREALIKYGKHLTDCMGGISGRECTCGLERRIKEVTHKGEHDEQH